MRAAIHIFLGPWMASFSVVIFIVQKICRFDATQNGMAHAVTFVAILPPHTIQNKREEKKERNKIKYKLFHFLLLFHSIFQYSFTFWPSTKFDEIHAFIEFLIIYISVSQKFKFGNFFARSDGFAFIRIDDTFFFSWKASPCSNADIF